MLTNNGIFRLLRTTSFPHCLDLVPGMMVCLKGIQEAETIWKGKGWFDLEAHVGASLRLHNCTTKRTDLLVSYCAIQESIVLHDKVFPSLTPVYPALEMRVTVTGCRILHRKS
jgi:hypothetical protein